MINAGIGAGRRVLVVDDHVASVTSLSLVLSLLGYEVRCAFDGVEALRCAEEFKPEIAILDLSLPLLDGYAVAKRMRAMDATREPEWCGEGLWGNRTRIDTASRAMVTCGEDDTGSAREICRARCRTPSLSSGVHLLLLPQGYTGSVNAG